MAGGPDIIILLIDVGPDMNDMPLTSGGEDDHTPLESSLKIAHQIVFQKIFAGSKDEVGVVLFGTVDTDNPLSGDGGYENISHVWEVTTPTIELVKYLKEQVKPGPAPADFIDAIVVAMDIITSVSRGKKKVGDRKIYLFTDGSSDCSDDQLDDIMAGLKSHDIELIIIGPTLPQEDRDEDNDSPAPGPSHGRAPPPPPPHIKKTARQIEGERVLSLLVSEGVGCSFSYPEAMNISSFIRKTAKKQTTRFSGVLEIGPQLKIPCKIFTKTMQEKPTTWKKLSAISQSSANPGSMAVKLERSYHLQDEDETEVDVDNTVKGYRYGKSLIPVSSEDEDNMKYSAGKSLSLLGFTSQDKVRQAMLIGSSVQVLIANPDSQPSVVSLSSIIHALYEMDMAAVVRYVFRNNATPKLCALVPHIKPGYECLFVYQLPFMEDIRQYSFSSLSQTTNTKLKPSAEQLKAVDDLINNMELSDDVDFNTKEIRNPLIQRTFQCLEHRCLNPDDPLPSLEPALERCLQPNPSLLSQCSSSVLKVKNIFPLTRVDKKAKNEATNVWKQSTDINLDDEGEEPSSKRLKTDETDFSVASLAKGELHEVGTVNPVEDYKKIIESSSDSYDKATKQLQEVILRLIKGSLGDVMYSKAMNCVTVLRSEAINASSPVIFNDYLKRLKEELIGTRYSPFWDEIVKEKISLITVEECDASDITQGQSDQFLCEEVDAVAPVEEAEEEEEADDLLAMMD